MLAIATFLLGCALAYALMLLLGYRAQILWAIGMICLGIFGIWIVVTRFWV
jgi:hypothetical protein